MATPPKPSAPVPPADEALQLQPGAQPGVSPSAKPTAQAHPQASPEAPPSLIDFPSAFPIKVMGAYGPGFEPAMVDIARQFDATFDTTTVERRPSKNGNYLGLTLTVTATSREQLDGLYRALSAHPMVKMVL